MHTFTISNPDTGESLLVEAENRVEQQRWISALTSRVGELAQDVGDAERSELKTRVKDEREILNRCAKAGGEAARRIAVSVGRQSSPTPEPGPPHGSGTFGRAR